jgi:hypothetical protein
MIMLSFFLSALLLQSPVGQGVRLEDNSDWWSIIRQDSWGEGIKPSNQAIDEANFRILGIELGGQFEEIATKLGKAQSIERGDAATGREQVCYVSDDASIPVQLIFEFGEDQRSFTYLRVERAGRATGFVMRRRRCRRT